MAIIPAVYVTVEDRSFALPSIRSTRTGFTVILCDRGEHNKVVQIDSISEFHTLYGKPNLDRTGQAHYIADKLLQYNARLYVVRPMLMDSDIETENAAIANRFIKYNAVEGSVQKINGGLDKFGVADGFIFTQDSPIVNVSLVAYEQFEIGDYIFNSFDTVSQKLKIVAKDTTLVPSLIEGEASTYDYSFILESNYVYSLPSAYLSGTKRQYAFKYYEGSRKIQNVYVTPEVPALFNFTTNSNIVVCATENDFSSISERQWLYPANQANSTPTVMRQVISKVFDDINLQWLLTLDDKYMGVSTLEVTGEDISFQEAYIYEPFTLETQTNIRDDQSLDVNDSDNLWYFHAVGAGKYYNKLFIVGNRNVRYEKLFVTNDGVPLYKYAFMDIYVNAVNDDGTTTILEGPFSCSIIKETLNGSAIRDIFSGEELYIENIINLRSKYIRCKSTNAIAHSLLLSNAMNPNGTDPEALRIHIQKLFANEKIFRSNVLAESGILLESGEDGILYDEFGRLNLTNNKIKSLIINTFRNTLASSDQSIENTKNVMYPWFNFDYCLSGGYDRDIQAAARQLVDLRNDTLLLADTGAISWKAEDDIVFRQNDMAWNTWNAMIYVGYREIFDPYTGRRIWLSPVYHAIENHLKVDANYWISEPVAGIEKGAISDPIKLAYKANLIDLEDLIENELNPTIIEPDGVYLLTQYTTYKRLSVMKRANTVKFIHYLRKEIPSLLKDILQRKFTAYWTSLAQARVQGFMIKFVDTGSGSERYASVSNFSVAVEPDEARSELNIILSIRPLRTIESIHVNIIVN